MKEKGIFRDYKEIKDLPYFVRYDGYVYFDRLFKLFEENLAFSICISFGFVDNKEVYCEYFKASSPFDYILVERNFYSEEWDDFIHGKNIYLINKNMEDTIKTILWMENDMILEQLEKIDFDIKDVKITVCTQINYVIKEDENGSKDN